MEKMKLYNIGDGRLVDDEFTKEEIILWKFLDNLYENENTTYTKLHGLCSDCIPTWNSYRDYMAIAEGLFKLQAFCEEIFVPELNVYLSEIEVYEIFRFIEGDLYSTYLKKQAEAEEE